MMITLPCSQMDFFFALYVSSEQVSGFLIIFAGTHCLHVYADIGLKHENKVAVALMVSDHQYFLMEGVLFTLQT